jgi:hypothetical protein
MVQRFGRYWLHEKIGQGGMAEIFRATIGPDPRTYAFELVVKRLLPHLQKDKAMVDMFLTEADIAKLLRHPNIVQVFESGIVDGQTYIAMEYVRGTELATLVETLRKRRLRFPSDLTIYVGLQVLRALDYVHRAATPAGEPMDIVHRDVTPSNIYLTYDGQVKLGDFGVARVSFLEERDDPLLKGKAAYMSPEVIAGAEVDQRLDLWSLAVSLWEMLTTGRPYEGISESEIMSGAKLPRIEAAHELSPDVSPELSAILEHALSPKPRRRPHDALELYRSLKMYLREAGIQVDASALGRFVLAVSGARPPETQSQATGRPGTGVFQQPAYFVPVGPSPTQRYEIVQRRRRYARPAMALAGLAAVGVVAPLAWSHLRAVSSAARTAGLSRVKPRTEAAGVTPSGAPGARVPGAAGAPRAVSDAGSASPERSRPSSADAFTIDLTGGETDFQMGPSAPRFDGLMQQARHAARHDNFSTAEASYKDALALKPKSVQALLGRANALLELKRYTEAEQSIRSALAVDAHDARAFLLLGDVLWVEGHDKAAREAYQRCIDIDPKAKTAQTARRILGNL